MKKVQLVTNSDFVGDFQWLPGYVDVLSKDYEVTVEKVPKNSDADCYIFFWADQVTGEFIKSRQKDCKYIVYCRRYEMYNPWIGSLPWNKIDEVIVLQDFLAERFKKIAGKVPIIIPNGIQRDKWRYKERKHGNKIAVVGYIVGKKNPALALQILNNLPKGYEVHFAGKIQEEQLYEYLGEYARQNYLSIKFNTQGVENMDEWLEDKNYLLSCSTAEGCPNNVIEAMAKGIKPIVHNWPGARYLFDNYVFNTIEEAVQMIHPLSPYKSYEYDIIVDNRFSTTAYTSLKKLVDYHLNTTT